MATINGLTSLSAQNYGTLNMTAITKDSSSQSLRNQASSLGITSFDSYIKTDAEGNVVGVDKVKLTSDIYIAKKEEKEQEKIELERKEEADSFVKTEKGDVKKEEVKSKAEKHKTSIDDEYKKALMQFAGISDEIADIKGISVEKLQKELNQLKANKDKLMGSTSTDLQVFDGAGKLLNKINKFFKKADSVSAEVNAKVDNTGVFDIKSRDEILAEHRPINPGNSDLYENPFFKSAFQTTQKEAKHKEFVA